MKRTNKCPKCGSGDIISNAKPMGGSDYAAVWIATYRKPDAIIFKGQQTSSLSAWVCADCGYLEWYADNPKRIRV